MNTYDIVGAGRFMANGRIVSNSGRNIQLQNLPQNHIKTLSEARTLLKLGEFELLEALYDNVPDVLSQLIRTMLIPRDGCEFIICDFSAIEARVLAWLAGEEWRLEAFRNGEDIYCASASKMFGKPVVKNGENGELRQKGKVAELACIAEGQPVLTDKGLIPIQDVTTDIKLWDGMEWVSHDGVIFRGEREVITYDGLTATPDHLVYIEGQSRPVRFELAASVRARLIQTGNGRRAVRLGKNNKSRKTMELINEPVLCINPMPRMRSSSVAELIQLKTRTVKGLSKLHTAKSCPSSAGTKTHGGQTTMRKSERTGIFELRRKGNKIRVSQCNRGNRSDRHKRRLCSRKSSLCKTQNKLCQSAQKRIKSLRTKALAIRLHYGDTKVKQRYDTRRDYPKCESSRIREKKELAQHSKAVKVYDILNAGRHHRFTVSGKLVHNCGYQGGANALRAMGALEMGLTEDDLPKLITDWREANPRIVQFWWDVERTVMKAYRDYKAKPLEAKPLRVGKVSIECVKGALRIKLPSERKLTYLNPKEVINKQDREALSFKDGNRHRTEMYAGKYVENITQATARDLLAEALLRLERAGLDVVAHVHDEVIVEVPKNSVSVEDVEAIMNEVPDWAFGLPISSSGYRGDFYYKD